jgi:hypothetical protein
MAELPADFLVLVRCGRRRVRMRRGLDPGRPGPNGGVQHQRLAGLPGDKRGMPLHLHYQRAVLGGIPRDLILFGRRCAARRQRQAGGPQERSGLQPHGIGTSRGLAVQLKPENHLIALPLPRLPAAQLSFLLMQLSVHIAITVLSHAPHQSA